MQMQKSDHRAGGPYLKVTISVNDPIDVREVCRATEYLGGTRADLRFSFFNAERRDEALKLLCEDHRKRYCAAVEAEAKGGHVEGAS